MTPEIRWRRPEQSPKIRRNIRRNYTRRCRRRANGTITVYKELDRTDVKVIDQDGIDGRDTYGFRAFTS